MPYLDNQPLEPHEPSTLTSICGISPNKLVPGKTSICPFLWRNSFASFDALFILSVACCSANEVNKSVCFFVFSGNAISSTN